MFYLRIFLLIIFFIVPGIARASFIITEIMYDQEGSDSGYEWVEFKNNGTETLDPANWYFWEADTNHGIYPDNFSVVDPGEYFVVVQDITKFTSRYGTNISLAKSSFSLNNTGEVLGVADQDKKLVDTVTYNHEIGAAGDGNSLGLVSNTWVVTTPTPGSSNNSHDTLISQTSQDDSDKSSSAKNDKSDEVDERTLREKSRFNPYYELYISFPDVIVAGNPARIQAGVYHVTQRNKTHRLGGYYTLNLGDGGYIDTRERIDTEYVFSAPGTYVLTLEFHRNSLTYELEEPEFIYTKVINVINHGVSILGFDEHAGLQVKNNMSEMIDISGWELVQGAHTYRFPNHTLLAPHAMITISSSTHSFDRRDEFRLPVILRNTLQEVIHLYDTQQVSIEKEMSMEAKSVSVTVNTSIQDLPEQQVKHDEVIAGPTVGFLDEFLESNSGKQEVDLGVTHYEYQESSPEKEGVGRTPWYLAGASGVTALGVIARQYLKRREGNEEEILGDIELIDS